MSTAISNAVARLNARQVDTPGTSPETAELILLRDRLDAVQAKYDGLLVSNREYRAEVRADMDRMAAELSACGMQRDDAERRCAEMQGRLAGIASAPAPAASDNSKYEMLVAEHTDLRVMHGSCAARESGLQQVIAELRRANETLSTQVQAALTEEEEPEAPESEDEGCEIEVLRGGDDRIRSLKVRYTK